MMRGEEESDDEEDNGLNDMPRLVQRDIYAYSSGSNSDSDSEDEEESEDNGGDVIEYHEDINKEENVRLSNDDELVDDIQEDIQKVKDVTSIEETDDDSGEDETEINDRSLTRSQGRPGLRDIQQPAGSHRNRFEVKFQRDTRDF